jgi:ketosteroid isomerase-like protein
VMRGTIVAALGVVATIAPLDSIGGAARAAEAAGRTDQALARVAEERKAAYNARDAATVASLYTANGYYVSAPIVAHGRAEIQAYFQRGIDAGGHIDAIQILSSGQSGDLGYTVGT